MSGGSYDYVCHRIAEIEIRHTEGNKRRVLFQKLLKLVAEAMHDIEWVDSGDCGEGDENKAIDAVLNFLKVSPEERYKCIVFDEIEKLLKTKENENK